MNNNIFHLIFQTKEYPDVNYTNTSAGNFGFCVSEQNEQIINKDILYASTMNKLKTFLLHFVAKTNLNNILINKGHVLPYSKSKQINIFYVILDDIYPLLSEKSINDAKNTYYEQYRKYRNDIIDNVVNYSLKDKTKYNQQKQYLKKDIMSMIIESFDRTLKYDLISNKIKRKSRLLINYNASCLSFDDLYEIPIFD